MFDCYMIDLQWTTSYQDSEEADPYRVSNSSSSMRTFQLNLGMNGEDFSFNETFPLVEAQKWRDWIHYTDDEGKPLYAVMPEFCGLRTDDLSKYSGSTSITAGQDCHSLYTELIWIDTSLPNTLNNGDDRWDEKFVDAYDESISVFPIYLERSLDDLATDPVAKEEIKHWFGLGYDLEENEFFSTTIFPHRGNVNVYRAWVWKH